MNQKTLTTLAVGAGIAFLFARAAVQKGLSSGVLRTGGDAQRMSGISHLYDTNSAQASAVNAAIASNWNDLQNSVFKTQPDFWA